MRLVGLLARDTPTATLLLTAQAPTARKWGPQAVGDQLAAWAVKPT